MIRPPFAARVALGVAVTVVDEARRLPSTAVSMPMTAVSQLLQNAMRVQQTVTELAIKGDSVLALFGNSPEEKPSWATFDDDDPDVENKANFDDDRRGDRGASDAPLSTEPEFIGDPTAEVDVPEPVAAGRFALYSSPPQDLPPSPAAPKAAPARKKKVAVPEIAEYLDYDVLTLAQLRARLRTIALDDLTTLLDYENATKSRAPYQTMLANRITTARAK